MQRQHARPGAGSSGPATGQQPAAPTQDLAQHGNAAANEQLGAIAEQIPDPLSLHSLLEQNRSVLGIPARE